MLFCPCVVNVENRQDITLGTQLSRRNNPERGIRGVHVGLPRNSAGWLVYIPSTSKVLVSQDVAFDEDFVSTLSYTESRIPGGTSLQPPSHPSLSSSYELHNTEDPQPACSNSDTLNEAHQNDPTDVFIGNPSKPPPYSMEEYVTDNLLPYGPTGGAPTNLTLTKFDQMTPTNFADPKELKHYIKFTKQQKHSHNIQQTSTTSTYACRLQSQTLKPDSTQKTSYQNQPTGNKYFNCLKK